MEQMYQLSNEDIEKFQNLFEMFDREKESLGIDAYGVSITTLEEVFLRTSENSDPNIQSD